MTEINILLTTALQIINFVRQSKLVSGKTKEQLDRAYLALLDANRELEDEAIRLSRNIADQ